MKISIVTICYNEVERIEETILSILNQTYKNFELIVVDGGSTDGTKLIIEKYRNKIKHFMSEPDSGIYNAMNKGLKLCSGTYVNFMNGGDAYYSKHVLLNLVSNAENADIIYGDVNYGQRSGGYKIFKHPSKLTLLFLALSTINHQSLFIKIPLINRIGGFKESYKICSDDELFLNAILRYRASIKYLPITIATFNREGISSDNEYEEIKWREKKQILKIYLPLHLRIVSIVRYNLVKYKNYFFPGFIHRYLNSRYEKYLFK